MAIFMTVVVASVLAIFLAFFTGAAPLLLVAVIATICTAATSFLITYSVSTLYCLGSMLVIIGMTNLLPFIASNTGMHSFKIPFADQLVWASICITIFQSTVAPSIHHRN